jgi:hypothetical protein
MDQKLVAEGYDIQDLPYYEIYLPESSTGEVWIYYDHPLTAADASLVQSYLQSQGAELTADVRTDGNALIIPFKKTFGPLIFVVGAAALLGSTFFGWQIFEDVGDITSTIPSWVWIAGGALLVVMLVRSSVPARTTDIVFRGADTFVQGKAAKHSR